MSAKGGGRPPPLKPPLGETVSGTTTVMDNEILEMDEATPWPRRHFGQGEDTEEESDDELTDEEGWKIFDSFVSPMHTNSLFIF